MHERLTRIRRTRRNEPLVYPRELERSDVPMLTELEALSHPPEVRDGVEFFETLLGADWHEWPVPFGCPRPGKRPIRLGLTAGTKLVGYIIGRPCRMDAQTFVHVDDLVVLADQRRHLPRLIDGFVRQCVTLYPGEPLVAHAYETQRKLFERHRRAFDRLGARLSEIEAAGERIGRPLYRIRWEVRPRHGVCPPSCLTAGGDDPVRAAVPEPAGTVRASGAEYDVEVARTVAQWESLAGEWDRLLARVAGSTAFQTFRFLRLWWDHFAVSGSPFIIGLRRAGELVGIAPLAVFPSSFGSRAFRQLGFIGSRWEIDRPRFLFAGDTAETEACAHAVAEAIAARRKDWDLLYLYEQPPESSVIAALARSLRSAGYLVGDLPDSICPFIRTDGGWDAFLDTRSRSFRKNLQRGRRRLERQGPVEYRVINDATAVDAAFDQYLEVEARSWKADTDAGLCAEAVDQAFYRDLTNLLGRDRRIEFRFIDVAGAPVAGTFGIRHGARTPCDATAAPAGGDHFYSLKIAHDQRFAVASPGTLLESLEIRDCFESDVVEYDFLGGFLTNKHRWTDDARMTTQVFAFPRRGRWVPFYLDRFVLRPRVKRLLRRAGWLQPVLAWRDRLVQRIRKAEPEQE